MGIIPLANAAAGRPACRHTTLRARNPRRATVRTIPRGAAIANAALDVAGQRVVASITVEAVDSLEIKEGDEVTAVIKASDVMLATD